MKADAEGAAEVYVNWSLPLVALVPDGVVTVTSTTPRACAGEVALMVVAFITLKLAAAGPKFTNVAPVKLVPVTVTPVPPPVVPELGLTLVTVGIELAVPLHTPAIHTSPEVLGLPSLHAVPSGTGGFEHTPFTGLHVPEAWH